MSALRTCRPRILRLDLSPRYQHLRRHPHSTAPPSTPPPSSSGPPPPKPSFFKRYRSAILWGSLSLTLGAITGQFIVHTISPPPLPDAGTREDEILMADLNQRIDEEFKVKVLRGKCLGVAKQLKGEEGGWCEVISLPLDLNDQKEAGAEDSSLLNHMHGAGRLGVERLFWDRGEGKLVAVVFFGGALCGWPGVTHGGAIATLMAEKLSLAAALAEDKQAADVLAAATPQRLPGTGNHAKMFAPASLKDEPKQLSIGYVKPTYANQFYVARVKPALPMERASELTPEVYGGAEYEATLETMDGKTCVKARARFAPSTVTQRVEKEVVGGAKESYEDFRRWMWPSRQSQSQAG